MALQQSNMNRATHNELSPHVKWRQAYHAHFLCIAAHVDMSISQSQERYWEEVLRNALQSSTCPEEAPQILSHCTQIASCRQTSRHTGCRHECNAAAMSAVMYINLPCLT